MKSYIIEGGKKLEGTVKIGGSKNASLPILAACILNQNVNKLYNVPSISDTKITLQILRLLGCKIKRCGGKIEINSRNMTKTKIPEHLMREMRSTVILAGAILGRFKEVTFSYPGGCDIGARPIDLHLNAFRKMGIDIVQEAGFIKCKANKIIGTNIDLDFPSVGATENILLAAVTAEGTTIINNAAMEPEIIDLVNFLKKMGAKIDGEGTKCITIKGVSKLHEVSYNIMPDRIEAGTILCAVAGSGGNVILQDVVPNHLSSVINKLEECGCVVEVEKNRIKLQAPRKLKCVDLKTMPYPGFPTDMQQVFSSMLTKANGTSIIIENIFESRYKFFSELRKMGAKVTIEGKTAIITGVRKLHGTTTVCSDLRGGAALIIAGIIAKGKTRIENIDFILRGYENIDDKLNSLGAKIKIENY